MIKNLWRLSLLVVTMLVAVQCSSSDDEGGSSSSISFLDSGTTSIDARGYDNAPRIVLSGKIGASYTLTLTEGAEWCSFKKNSKQSTVSGTIATANQLRFVYLKANNTKASRQAVITVVVGDAEPVCLTINQESYDVPASYDRAWVELPAYADGDDSNIQYVTHHAPVSSTTTVRNFTVRFNREKRIAEWVAYPLHASYMTGGYNRTDAWAFDPKIPAQYQANINSGSYRGGGVRGHQCMSNHRYHSYSSEMNAQTFYSSNIMPQEYNFNSGSWLEMESAVTANACADTLYTVTGNYGVRSWSSDRSGNSVAMPEYCWKVLLRTKSGRTGKRIDAITDASELIAIGFWAPNSSTSKKWSDSFLVSVEYIEQQTGFKFFPMLNEAIADRVKAQKNPSDWGI